MARPLRLAFAGFRHGHVLGLYKLAQRLPDVTVVGTWEEHPQEAAGLLKSGDVQLTCASLAELLESTQCDAVAVGDFYSRRGSLLIECLRAGKHVIADKPICTDLAELDRIEALARERHLAVGCLLDLRGSGAFRTLRRLIGEGAIGEVRTVTVTAQHPLLLASRPGWYFEPGKQGGTINDIGIHAVDAIPWITGRQIVEVVAARQWNARLPQFPHFGDAAQVMALLDNGGGMLADFSYLAPDGVGYGMPQYWRLTCHGDGGVLEAQAGATSITIAAAADKSVCSLPADPGDEAIALKSFMADIEGHADPEGLNTSSVLAASRKALLLQQAADRGESRVRI